MPKTPKATTIIKVVATRINKLFVTHVDGTEGWKYATQSTWQPQDIFQRVIQAILEQSSVEDVCSEFPGCSADTVLRRIENLDFNQSVKQINAILRDLFQHYSLHWKTKLTLAIDITDKEYYGDSTDECSVGSKPKNGTSYFNRYFTAVILTPTYRIPIYFRPLRNSDSLAPSELLTEMLEELWWLPIERILGDGYFYAFNVTELCNFHKIEFIFHMKKYSSVKLLTLDFEVMQLMLASAAGIDVTDQQQYYEWLVKKQLIIFECRVPEQYVTSPKDKLVFRYICNITHKKNGQIKVKLEWYVYITNSSISAERVIEIYKLRWGIETGYRVENRFQALTTSPSLLLRLWFVGLGFILVALWLWTNLLLNQSFEKLDLNTINTATFRPRLLDRLSVIVKKFIRWLKGTKWFKRREFI